MEHVDFGYIGMFGFTIYRICFQIYLTARGISNEKDRLLSWSYWSSWFSLKRKIRKTEEIFAFLVEQGKINGYNVDAILEKPDNIGDTCFSVASQCSKKICDYFIKRDIKINNTNGYHQLDIIKDIFKV